MTPAWLERAPGAASRARILYPVATGAYADCTNAWGAWDLSGNVAEWTASFSFTGEDGVDYYFRAGGSFHTSDNGYVRCADSSNIPETDADDDLGFRCCADLGGD
jgi:eukaryotic-like serine/threonine-protein kinase